MVSACRVAQLRPAFLPMFGSKSPMPTATCTLSCAADTEREKVRCCTRSKGYSSSHGDVVVRTAPSALCWCEKVMFDRRAKTTTISRGATGERLLNLNTFHGHLGLVKVTVKTTIISRWRNNRIKTPRSDTTGGVARNFMLYIVLVASVKSTRACGLPHADIK